MYEVDQASKDKLEEICDIRQPVLFDFENDTIMETCSRESILNNYHAFEVKIRNVKDTNTNLEMYMPVSLSEISMLAILRVTLMPQPLLD
jgi:hypothetical protein